MPESFQHIVEKDTLHTLWIDSIIMNPSLTKRNYKKNQQKKQIPHTFALHPVPHSWMLFIICTTLCSCGFWGKIGMEGTTPSLGKSCFLEIKD